MDFALTIAVQVIIMFLLMAIGFICYKAKLLSDETSGQLSNFLITIVIPIVLLCSYQTDFDTHKALMLLLTFALSMVAYGIGIPIADLAFRREPTDRYRVRRIAVPYSNAAFMGIPLIQATLGAEGVFYLSANIVAFNVLCWSHCVYELTGDRRDMSIRRVLRAPAVIGAMLGILLFLSPVKLPGPIYTALGYIGNMNTPLAMLLIGIFLAQTDIRSAIRDGSLYLASFLRLLVVPFIVLVLLRFVPSSLQDIKLVVLIATSAPVATIVGLFPRRFGRDYVYGSNLVTVSTLFSVVTMPLMIMLTEYLW